MKNMYFEIEPLPENADGILAALHGELQTAVSDFEAQAVVSQSDRNQTRVKRAQDLEFTRRDVIAELDRISCTLTADRQDFTRHSRELRRPQPATGDTGLRYQEVRAMLRTLTSAKRKSLLQDALDSNDALLLWAVIEAPGYLAGMDAEEHTSFSEQAHDALHGDETRELEQAEALANGLVKHVEKARAYINSFGMETLANAV